MQHRMVTWESIADEQRWPDQHASQYSSSPHHPPDRSFRLALAEPDAALILMLESECVACSAKGAMMRWMHAKKREARQQRARRKAFLRQAAMSRHLLQSSITAWGLCASFAQVRFDLVSIPYKIEDSLRRLG